MAARTYMGRSPPLLFFFVIVFLCILTYLLIKAIGLIKLDQLAVRSNPPWSTPGDPDRLGFRGADVRPTRIMDRVFVLGATP